MNIRKQKINRDSFNFRFIIKNYLTLLSPKKEKQNCKRTIKGWSTKTLGHTLGTDKIKQCKAGQNSVPKILAQSQDTLAKTQLKLSFHFSYLLGIQ